MQHKFVCVKRYKKRGAGGDFNIPYGTKLLSDDRFIYFNGDCYNGKTVCAIESDDSYNYFSIDDDGNGLNRGELTKEIINLIPNDGKHQAQWNKLWQDDLANTLRRKDYEDRWLWSKNFYQASIDKLEYILNLIKEA